MEKQFKLTKEQLEIHKRNKYFTDNERENVIRQLMYSDEILYSQNKEFNHEMPYDYSLECDRALIENLFMTVRRLNEKIDWMMN